MCGCNFQVLEKGPQNISVHILSIIYCLLHYLDMNSAAVQPVNTDMLKVVARYVEVSILFCSLNKRICIHQLHFQNSFFMLS